MIHVAVEFNRYLVSRLIAILCLTFRVCYIGKAYFFVMVKVFGIGLNKTGTTTLGKVFKDCLKSNHLGCSGGLLRQCRKGNFDPMIEAAKNNDTFEDFPWCFYYEMLDNIFPGSKFIMTRRKSSDVWLKSLMSHSLRTGKNHCRVHAYGLEYPHQNPAKMIEIYEAHNNAVREYFSGRPNDFLEICWEEGDGIEKLFGFLNLQVPSDYALPHANKSKGVIKKYNLRRLSELGISIEA